MVNFSLCIFLVFSVWFSILFIVYCFSTTLELLLVVPSAIVSSKTTFSCCWNPKKALNVFFLTMQDWIQSYCYCIAAIKFHPCMHWLLYYGSFWDISYCSFWHYCLLFLWSAQKPLFWTQEQKRRHFLFPNSFFSSPPFYTLVIIVWKPNLGHRYDSGPKEV